MGRTYTVLLQSKELKVTDTQLHSFGDELGISGDLRARVSELLLLDLFVYATEFGVSPHDVIDELQNLENGDGNTETKPATQFNRPPLGGLWHKHFFCAHFLAHNISNALGGGRLRSLIDEVMYPEKSSTITPEMVSELAHRVTREPVTERADSNRLTGEWIVFAKHEGKNYYLCLNTHNAGDQKIAGRIKAHCERDFPFLSSIL